MEDVCIVQDIKCACAFEWPVRAGKGGDYVCMSTPTTTFVMHTSTCVYSDPGQGREREGAGLPRRTPAVSSWGRRLGCAAAMAASVVPGLLVVCWWALPFLVVLTLGLELELELEAGPGLGPAAASGWRIDVGCIGPPWLPVQG